MSNLRVAIVFALGIAIGYYASHLELSHERCADYVTTHSEWNGWLSMKNGVYRCFWVESHYPYRTKQGVIDVK